MREDPLLLAIWFFDSHYGRIALLRWDIKGKAIKFGCELFGREPKMKVTYRKTIHDPVDDEVDIIFDMGLIKGANIAIQRYRFFVHVNLLWVDKMLPRVISRVHACLPIRG